MGIHDAKRKPAAPKREPAAPKREQGTKKTEPAGAPCPFYTMIYIIFCCKHKQHKGSKNQSPGLPTESPGLRGWGKGGVPEIVRGGRLDAVSRKEDPANQKYYVLNKKVERWMITLTFFTVSLLVFNDLIEENKNSPGLWPSSVSRSFV